MNSEQSSQIIQYSHPGESTFKIFTRQFLNPLIFIFIGATILAFALGKVVDAIVVLSVILINAVIGFIQEFQAGKAIVTLEVGVVATGNRTETGHISELLQTNATQKSPMI